MASVSQAKIIAELEKLQRDYNVANQLMSLRKDSPEFRLQLRAVDASYASLMKLCQTLSGSEEIPGTAFSKTDLCTKKEEFDEQVRQWLASVTPQSPMTSRGQRPRDVGEARSVRSVRSHCTSASVRSEMERSRICLLYTSPSPRDA